MAIKEHALTAALAAMMTAGSAQAGGMAPGLYECWSWGQAQMIYNVTVTGASTYRGEDSGETGTYSLNGKTLTWETGPLVGIMPDGFVATYEVRGTSPTISYGVPGNTEAAFCENAP